MTLSCHDHGNCELCDALEAENARLRTEFATLKEFADGVVDIQEEAAQVHKENARLESEVFKWKLECTKEQDEQIRLESEVATLKAQVADGELRKQILFEEILAITSEEKCLNGPVFWGEWLDIKVAEAKARLSRHGAALAEIERMKAPQPGLTLDKCRECDGPVDADGYCDPCAERRCNNVTLDLGEGKLSE